jgi:tetratricopeptide (TPR) repeat protein
MITGNKFTKGGIEGLKKIFTTDAFTGYLGEGKTLLPGGRYRPLSQAIFNIYYTVFGEKAFGLHLLNIILFSISVLLLYKMLRMIFSDNKKRFLDIPFIATLLYAVHPLNTEVVANIKSLDLILAAVFSFLTMISAINYAQKKHIVSLMWVVLFLFLGILSKETAITFYALIPLTLLLFIKPKTKDIVVVQLVMTIVIAAYFALRFAVLGNTTDVVVKELLNNPFLYSTAADKYATIIYTWLIYLKLIIFPHPLTHDYYPFVIEIQQWSKPLVILSALIFTSLSALSIRHLFRFFTKKEEASVYLYGFMFFMIVFSISSNLVFNIGTFMNERFVFIADIGFFIIAAKGLLSLEEKYFKSRFPAIVILAVPVLLFSAKTIGRNPVWKDDYTLFRTDVKVSSNSAKCTVSAGGKTYEKALKINNLTTKKRLMNEAKAFISKGLRIHPKYYQAWELLGNVNYELENYDDALICYNNCLLLNPADKNVLISVRNLAIKSREKSNWAVSDSALRILSRKQYNIVNTKYLIANNLESQGKADSAIKILKEVIKLDSAYADAYNKLGQIYGKYKNDLGISEYYLLKAYSLDPSNSSVLENLGTLYAISRRLDKALYFFKESYKVNPDNPQIYTNISMVYRELGKPAKAEEWERKRGN